MATQACIDAIKAAAGGKLTDDDIADIAEAVEVKRKALSAEGRIDNLDQRLRQAARDEADQVRLAAALQRKHAALTAIARDRLETRVAGLVAQGIDYRQAVLAVLEGTTRGLVEGRHSVAATKLAFEGRYVGDMFAAFERERPHLVGRLREKTFLDDVVREMFELKEGGRPGITNNADAQFAAKTFATFAEVSRVDLNRLGANIGKLDGWAGPQVHDAYKLLKVTDEDWARQILPRLDLKRSFPDVDPTDTAALTKILRDIHLTIVTGRDATITAKEKGEVTGPANLAKSLSKHRVLHFKSADDWLAYSEAFGHGNVFTAMIAHQERSARLAAQMQMLGPNPEAMLDSLRQSLGRRIRNDPTVPAAKKAAMIKAVEKGDTIASALAEMQGLTLAPVDVTAARLGSNVRSAQSMAKLLGAVISALSDLVTSAQNLKYQGRPLFATYGRQLQMLFRGRPKGEQAEIAYLVGEGFDGIIDHINARYSEDGVPGAFTRATTTLFRWSGLTWWTDTMRSVNGRLNAAWMGRHVGESWDALPARYRNVLSQHGILGPQWEILRRAQFRADNGNTYVTPDRVAALPDDAILPLARERLDAVEAGLADRTAQRQRADAREQDWIAKRTSRFGDKLAAASERLTQRQAQLVDKAGKAAAERFGSRIAELQERLAEIREMFRAGRALDERGDIADWKDVGKFRERIRVFEGSIRSAKKDAAKESKALGEAFAELWARREAELLDFVETMKQRATERAEAQAAEVADMPRRVQRVMDQARLELELAVRRFFADEGQFGVIETDARSRRGLPVPGFGLAGTRPGTVAGEVFRFMMQFKGFPIAFTNRVLGRAFFGFRGMSAGDRLLNQAPHIGQLFAGLFIAGYLSMTAKDFLRGQTPRDPTKAKTLLAALTQSGGAGIYGDFLFGQANRFGNSALETIAGPTAGAAAQLINLAARARDGDAKAGEVLNIALQNTPLINLWYARPAFDFLILNSLREWLSPGFLARQEKARLKDYGQRYFLPRTVPQALEELQ